MSFGPSSTALKRAYDAIDESSKSRKQTRTNNVIVENAIVVGENKHLRNVKYKENKGIMKLLVNHSTGQNNEKEERRLQEMAAKVGLAPEVFALCGFDFSSFISQSIISNRGRPTAKDFPIDNNFECEGYDSDDDTDAVLIMAHAEGTEIGAYLHKHNTVEDFEEVAEAVYVSQKELWEQTKICHNDLFHPETKHPQNVFLKRFESENGHTLKAMFIDFGLATDKMGGMEYQKDDLLEILLDFRQNVNSVSRSR